MCTARHYQWGTHTAGWKASQLLQKPVCITSLHNIFFPTRTDITRRSQYYLYNHTFVRSKFFSPLQAAKNTATDSQAFFICNHTMFWEQHWKPISHGSQQTSSCCGSWTGSWTLTYLPKTSLIPKHPAQNIQVYAALSGAHQPWSAAPELAATAGTQHKHQHWHLDQARKGQQPAKHRHPSSVTSLTFNSQREWIQLRSTMSKKKTIVPWNLLGDVQHTTQIGVVGLISRRYHHKYYTRQTATGDAHTINVLPGLQLLPVLKFARISLPQVEPLIIGDNGMEQKRAQQQQCCFGKVLKSLQISRDSFDTDSWEVQGIQKMSMTIKLEYSPLKLRKCRVFQCYIFDIVFSVHWPQDWVLKPKLDRFRKSIFRWCGCTKKPMGHHYFTFHWQISFLLWGEETEILLTYCVAASLKRICNLSLDPSGQKKNQKNPTPQAKTP